MPHSFRAPNDQQDMCQLLHCMDEVLAAPRTREALQHLLEALCNQAIVQQWCVSLHPPYKLYA